MNTNQLWEHEGKCQRCGKVTRITTMSRFNTDIICCGGNDSCSAKEQRHPKYKEASDAEFAAVQRGDMNFPGIGLPPDLKNGG